MSFYPDGKHGFTLIEIIVVLAIIAILSLFSYIPYDHYSQVSRLRVSEEKVRQVFEDAKLLTRNWQLFTDTANPSNADVGVVINRSLSSPVRPSHEIQVWVFRHGTPLNLTVWANAKLLKTIRLEDDININTLNLSEDTLIVLYTAPKGDSSIYRYQMGSLSPFAGGIIDVGIGYKTSTAGSLYRKIIIRP